jgi:hypothetical protein
VLWNEKERRSCGKGGNVRLTLRLNLSGYFSSNRVTIVLFPLPEGPDMTIGLPATGLLPLAAVVGGIVAAVRCCGRNCWARGTIWR